MDHQSDAILERLQALHPKLIDLSLGRIETLLERLGSPQDRLPPVIHVAGTNGKGSTIAFLRAILEAAGKTVHAYTSPHLVRFSERIVLAGEIINEDDLVTLLSECERCNGGEEITFFEITTAAAFLGFASVEADILLLETGLGGRLDATNLVKKPALTAITPIGMDHMHYLGNSLAAIAYEKAAIQKNRVPSIVGPQDDAALKVILETADTIGAKPFVSGENWQVAEEAGGFCYSSDALTLHLPTPSLPGGHQMVNAGTAIACIEKLPHNTITDHAISTGLCNAVWPGRLQKLTEGLLVDKLADGWELWLDGGHNPAAGEALGDALTAWNEKPTYLISGMSENKQAVEFFQPLAAVAKNMRAIDIPGDHASLPAAEIASAGREAGFQAETASSFNTALNAILVYEPGPARILVCGSLYLLGHVYDQNQFGAP
jgi:dihydrofolate synthase/folylpolyglutamate synthase